MGRLVEDMTRTMPSMAHHFAAHNANSKGRVRTPVGHRYLDVLAQTATMSDTDGSSSSSSADEPEDGLELLVLGITSGTMMDDIDFALCRFTQANPEAPLCLDLIKVCV